MVELERAASDYRIVPVRADYGALPHPDRLWLPGFQAPRAVGHASGILSQRHASPTRALAREPRREADAEALEMVTRRLNLDASCGWSKSQLSRKKQVQQRFHCWTCTGCGGWI
jgi:hypothetical protein